MELVPFILGVPRITQQLAARCPLPGVQQLDVLAPQSQLFSQLLNAGNNVAFGGLGMPAWVQLDCCTLPTAMVGFALARADVPPPVWDGLLRQMEKTLGPAVANAAAAHQGLVPVSEYTALHTLDAPHMVGFSLFGLVRGAGLGLRTKALALACYAAQTQVGMTQYNNSAVRTHALLGPLRITHAVAPPHSRPEETFVYELAVPAAAHLTALARGEVRTPPTTFPVTLEVPVDDPAAAGRAVAQLLADRKTVHVVTPGLLVRTQKTYITLHVA